MKLKGLDTITSPTSATPTAVQVDYDVVLVTQAVMALWNRRHIALLPFCIKCKVALDWHVPDNKGEALSSDVLFECPECKAKWVQDYDWDNKKTIEEKKIEG